jgi:hypothetical protein
MEEKDAKELVENYLESTRNPNLKLGKIEDKGEGFEADILTKDGSLVDKMLVDKRTGWMRSVYWERAAPGSFSPWGLAFMAKKEGLLWEL